MTSDMGFVDPTASIASDRVSPAPRLTNLAGKTVGLLDNSKEQADNILAATGKTLIEQYGVKEIVSRRAAHYSTPASEDIVEEMADACDAVICALGG